MRLKSPRVEPVDMEALSPEAAEALKPFEGRPVLNIFRTFAQAPKALTAFLAWGNYVLSRRNALAPREREIAILRVGWLCKSGYEFAQHRRIGLEAGLTEAEIEAIKAGSGAPGWSAADRAILQATDELHHDHFLGEATWRALSEHFPIKARMDLVFTVAQYTQVSMILNTFGVQLERPDAIEPELKPETAAGPAAS